MWGKRAFLFCLLSAFFAYSIVASAQERYYLITETELQSIEQQQTMQNNITTKLQLLVNELKIQLQQSRKTQTELSNKVQTLLKESKKLNDYLLEARKSLEASRTSFDKYDAEKSKQVSDLSSKLMEQSKSTNRAMTCAIIFLVMALVEAAIMLLYLLVFRKR